MSIEDSRQYWGGSFSKLDNYMQKIGSGSDINDDILDGELILGGSDTVDKILVFGSHQTASTVNSKLRSLFEGVDSINTQRKNEESVLLSGSYSLNTIPTTNIPIKLEEITDEVLYSCPSYEKTNNAKLMDYIVNN
jgi:hypothetical protein